MSAPHGYQPKQGDVILVLATVSRVTPADDPSEPVKIAARTASDRIVRCEIGDIDHIQAFAITEGTRVRWWEDGVGSAGNSILPAMWIYGEVIAVEAAERPEDRPHKDNLWIKEEGRWPRLTKFRKDVERA